MYDALLEACDRVDSDPDLRVLVLRGAGGAFSAGTDISQFKAFATGNDGIAYERRLDGVIDRLERVSRITIASIDGAAVGGGCAIALACDFRIVTTRARLGVPVSRTLGNCLSAANLARVVEMVGVARAKDLLLTGRVLDASELSAAGLCQPPVPAQELDAAVRTLASELATRAPSTVRATKALLAHIREARRVPAADDIIAQCYGSDEFREGVRAFTENRPPQWRPPKTESSK